MDKDKKVRAENGSWEMNYHPTVQKDSVKHLGAEFSPKSSKTRMTTYIKVNAQDH